MKDVQMKERWVTKLCLALLMMAMALGPPDRLGATPPGWGDWDYQRLITIDHTKVISALNYGGQTADFTVGDTVTGGSSGATATCWLATP